MTSAYTIDQYMTRLNAICEAASKLAELSDTEPADKQPSGKWIPLEEAQAQRLLAEPGDVDFAKARELERALSRQCRKLSDLIGEFDSDIKAHGPPVCDLRIREVGPKHRPGMMKINGDDWWLALTLSGGFALEIRVDVDDGESASEAAARFEKACAMSAQEKLAAMLAERGVQAQP